MSVLVVRWSGFAVPPVLLSSEQLFTDRPGPVQSKVPVILIQCRSRLPLQADIHATLPLPANCGHGIPPPLAVIEAQ